MILVRQKLIPQESLITSAVFAGMVLGAPVWGWDPRGVLGGSLVPWEEIPFSKTSLDEYLYDFIWLLDMTNIHIYIYIYIIYIFFSYGLLSLATRRAQIPKPWIHQGRKSMAKTCLTMEIRTNARPKINNVKVLATLDKVIGDFHGWMHCAPQQVLRKAFTKRLVKRWWILF